MTALAALIRLDRAPAEPAELLPIVVALRHGSRLEHRLVAPGPQALFALPSRTGDGASIAEPRAPQLELSERLWLALDGRIDNRAELGRALALDDRLVAELSDARLLLLAFDAWGEALFDRLVGPYVVVLVEAIADRLWLARDPLGGRALFFRRRGSAVAIASRPAALLAWGDAPSAPDEESIARFLAVRGPRPGATYFAGIEEVPSGALLRSSGSVLELVRSTALVPASLPGDGTARDVEQRLRELLDEAVARALPRSGATAILMSGGLDSTAVGATAARLLAHRSGPPPIAISWQFPELERRHRIDESSWIEATNAKCGLRALRVAGDELWPLADEPSWPRPIDSPLLSPYWKLRQRSLELAREAGRSVVLTGESGDQLWEEGAEWLRDLTAEGRLLEALVGLARGIALAWRGRPLAPPLRSSFARLLRPAGSSLLPEGLRPWLTPWAASRLAPESVVRPSEPRRPGAARLAPLLSPLDLAFLRVAEDEGAPFGIELRTPYRDRRLVELFLGVPAHLLYRPGESKRLLRRALVDRLPPEVLNRRAATSLLSLFDRGVAQRAGSIVRAALEDPDAIWPRYVRRDWLLGRAVAALGSPRDGIERVVLWHCYCLERWRRTLEERSSIRLTLPSASH